MNNLAFTPMELGILHEFQKCHADIGFPPPEMIEVTYRNNTGAGRYVGLKSASVLYCDDCYLDLKGRWIKMEGTPYGLMAVVSVANSRLEEIEIAVNGNGAWDGFEKKWEII